MSDVNKYLIREYFEFCDGGLCEDLLTEEEKRRVKENKVLILSGKLQEAERKNGNGRVYPLDTLKREVERYQEVINDRRAMGELDHPDSSVVNLQNVSHIVTKIWWEGNSVMGKLEILSTPAGDILRSLVESGVKMGISSRALGSVSQDRGQTVVGKDLELICFDIVSTPSTPDAFMLKEHREVFSKQDKINNLLDDIIKR